MPDYYIPPVAITIYMTLNLIGIALLLVLVLTIVLTPNGRLHRDPTLINTFIVLILVNVINVLYWVGHGGSIAQSTSEGYKTLCLAQAALQAGTQAASAAVVFSMCFRVSYR
jgi:hypothetical protein